MRRIVLLIASLALLASPRAFAQDSTSSKQAVLQTVQKLFDGMRARDTAAMAQVLDSSARLITTFTRSGQPMVDVTTVPDFIKLVPTVAPGQLLDERLEDPDVEVEDNLASVWVKYRFYVGETFSHCGVDAMHLARTASGWKIVALADTRRPPAQCGG